jgi:inward rectifier potassium channel
MVTRFYNLDLQISQVNSLATSWTLVHPINEDSPMYGLSLDDLRERRAEILVQIQGMDDQLYHTVQQKTSYVAAEIIDNARFNPVLTRSTDGSVSVVDVSKLNSYTILSS